MLLSHGDLQPVLVPCTRLRTKTTLDYSLVEDHAVAEAAELAQEDEAVDEEDQLS